MRTMKTINAVDSASKPGRLVSFGGDAARPVLYIIHGDTMYAVPLSRTEVRQLLKFTVDCL